MEVIQKYAIVGIIITGVIGIILLVQTEHGIPKEIGDLTTGELHKKLQDPDMEFSCSTLEW